MHDPDAIVWRRDQDISVSQQGMKVLGVPLGRDEYAARFLEKKSEHHDVLFERIPLVPDVQACLLLSFCAATRANFYDDVSTGALQQSTLPFHLGGLGLASAVRTREGAHWASWADSVATVSSKNPDLGATIVDGLNSRADGCFAVANQGADRLVDLGVELPTWVGIVEGATPDHIHATPTDEPSVAGVGSSMCPTKSRRRSTLAILAGVPFHCFPTSYATRIDSELFRTLLLRRLRLPLHRACRCGRLLDSLGHHRSACAVSGALGRRGFAVETHLPRGRGQGFEQRCGP